MAVELLKEKGDNKPLGPNWQSAFLRRHPDLKSKISSPRARDRFLAQDHGIFNHWFDLFLEQKEKYCVHDDDVYNMDEKGVMLGVAGKVAVIIPKTEKNPHTSNGSGNRDWTTSTECISLTGRLLPSWTIFKGKLNLDKWHNTMERIGLAESTTCGRTQLLKQYLLHFENIHGSIFELHSRFATKLLNSRRENELVEDILSFNLVR